MPRRKLPPLVPEGMVTSEGAADVLGFAIATFYRYRREPGFPAPKRRGSGGRPALYSRAELLAWKASRER